MTPPSVAPLGREGNNPPGHPSGWSGGGLYECLNGGCNPSGYRNDTLFLKRKTDSGLFGLFPAYSTIPYPESLYIAPADDWSNYVMDYSEDTVWPWEAK